MKCSRSLRKHFHSQTVSAGIRKRRDSLFNKIMPSQIQKMVDLGLITPTGTSYKITVKGLQFLKQLEQQK